MSRRSTATTRPLRGARAVPEFRVTGKGEWVMTLAVFKVSDPGEIWKRLMRGRR